jgi:streptogramin lyase
VDLGWKLMRIGTVTADGDGLGLALGDALSLADGVGLGVGESLSVGLVSGAGDSDALSVGDGNSGSGVVSDVTSPVSSSVWWTETGAAIAEVAPKRHAAVTHTSTARALVFVS